MTTASFLPKTLQGCISLLFGIIALVGVISSATLYFNAPRAEIQEIRNESGDFGSKLDEVIKSIGDIKRGQDSIIETQGDIKNKQDEIRNDLRDLQGDVDGLKVSTGELKTDVDWLKRLLPNTRADSGQPR